VVKSSCKTLCILWCDVAVVESSEVGWCPGVDVIPQAASEPMSVRVWNRSEGWGQLCTHASGHWQCYLGQSQS